MKRRSFLASAAALSLLSACTRFSNIPGAPEEVLAGRFSIVIAQNGNQRVESGNFTLASNHQGSRLDIGHSVTGTLARLSITRSKAVLETTGHRAESSSPEALMQQELGFSFPMHGFSRWCSMLGQSQIFEDGWAVTIVERDAAGLPKLLRAVRLETPASPAIRLTLFIDDRLRHAS